MMVVTRICGVLLPSERAVHLLYRDCKAPRSVPVTAHLYIPKFLWFSCTSPRKYSIILSMSIWPCSPPPSLLLDVPVKLHRSEDLPARPLKMDVNDKGIQITKAGPTDIEEISLLSAKASQPNLLIRTVLTNPWRFELAARETFARFLYARALDDSKSSNVVFKATDSQGVIVACIWLQWFHGDLRSWIDSQPGCSLPYLKPFSLTIPACIRKENYYKILVTQHLHRMAWMESKSQTQGKGHWCTLNFPATTSSSWRDCC